VLDDSVTSEADLSEKYERVAVKFAEARSAALDNTRCYLSMLSDFDVYVATSMRTRQDFRSMASTCESITGGIKPCQFAYRLNVYRVMSRLLS